MVQTKLILFLLIVATAIYPVAIHAEQPYTEPQYITSDDANSIIQIVETNDDDKSNLEPTPTGELAVLFGDEVLTQGQHYAHVAGFSSQSDIDYFLFQAPFTSNTTTPSISLSLYTHFYDINPQNGTWLQVTLETIDGTFDLKFLVEVPSNPYIESFDTVLQNNWTDVPDSIVSVRNIYATWRQNSEDRISQSLNRAYKNESGLISLSTFNETTNFSNTSTTDASWRVAKFNTQILFDTRELLPLEAYLNDVFVKISSPLNLTFSYDLEYSIYGASTYPSFRLNFPIYYFLFAFTPLALVILRRKMKKNK